MTRFHAMLVTILTMLPIRPAAAQEPPRLGESPIEDVIAAMTTEEKARLLVGMGMRLDIPGVPPMDPEDAKIPDKVPGAAGRTHAIPRLGIPSLTLADGPAGLRIDPVRDGEDGRTYHATAFPVATLLASTWDTALVREVGAAMGQEVREYGVDILLAPGINIHRNPLGGRNFEYYSEDPLLSGRIAAAFVAGVESQGVGTSIKHFAANNQEFNRMMLDTRVGERALREIYLRGFEIVVKEARPWTVMSAYNLINGTYASESRELLITILRDEWGFDGFVMSDWFAGRDPVGQMRAGNDVLMPGMPSQTAAIVDALENGTLGEAQLDENVARVLEVILRSPTFRDHAYTDRPDLEAAARVARRAAADGMVLLKNDDGALPLSPGAAVALFGNTSYRLIVGGTGSGDVNEAYAVSLHQGLSDAGHSVDPGLAGRYAAYIAEQEANRPPTAPFMLPPPIPEMAVPDEDIARLAGAADLAVVTIGRNSGELSDREVEGDFTLTDGERALLRDVARAFREAGKRIVVVMNVAGVIDVVSWRDAADAILLAWQPGQEGGHAITDVLTGVVNPSGRLPSTFPATYDDVPSARSFPGEVLPGREDEGPGGLFGRPSKVTYHEGIYVGYRYYDTFEVAPAYPFGYGLSYTTFGHSDVTLSSHTFADTVTARVTVTNTGNVAGRDVVQLYLSAPAGGLDRPVRELKAFAKTDLLEPGESQTLELRLTARELASYDPERSAWIAAPGRYTVSIGASAGEIPLQASFELVSERVVLEVNRALAPPAPVEELTPRTGEG